MTDAPVPSPLVPDPEPVFVDPSGRRGRVARRGAGLAGFAFLGYMVLLGASFARAPWVPHIALPIIGVPGAAGAPPALGAAAIALPAPPASALVRHASNGSSSKHTVAPSTGGGVLPGASPATAPLVATPTAANHSNSTPGGPTATPAGQVSPSPGGVTATASAPISGHPTAHPAPQSTKKP